MDFILDVERAKKGSGDNAGGGFSTGKNLVTIKQAYVRLAQSTSAEALHLDVESEGGINQGFDIWYKKGTGEIMDFAVDKIQSIAACLKLREMKESNGVYMKYDHELKKEVEQSGRVYADLFGKQLGLVLKLRLNEYNGKVSTPFDIALAFNAETGMTAKEILEGATEATGADSAAEYFIELSEGVKREAEQKRRDLDALGMGESAINGAPAPSQANNSFDDVIPF